MVCYMKNQKKHETKLFSVRIPAKTLKLVEKVSKEKQWSRNQTIAFLLEQQVSKAETNASSQG